MSFTTKAIGRLELPVGRLSWQSRLEAAVRRFPLITRDRLGGHEPDRKDKPGLDAIAISPIFWPTY